MSINVLISGGRKLMREGLSVLLEKHEDIRVVGETDDASAALKLAGPLGTNVLLLLMSHTGGTNGSNGAGAWETRIVHVVGELNKTQPEVKVLGLAAGATPAELKHFFAAGAIGCITLESQSEEVVAAIRNVARGQVYLSAKLSELLAHEYVNGTRKQRTAEPKLAARETEVLRRIAAGQSTKEIAYSMRVATKTIETHRRRVMNKLNRHSVAELTQYAIMKGLIAIPNHADA